MSSGCVIFDFDGVIADTETLHLAAYNAAFAGASPQLGVTLHISEKDYFTRYIAYGDREGFARMLADAGHRVQPAVLDMLCMQKARLFEEGMGAFAQPLPGVRSLLMHLHQRQVPRAICSGARGEEIRRLLSAFGLLDQFHTVVSIDDVRNGKPDPEGYNLAFDRLFVQFDGNLDRKKSLVIEDSAGGCAAGRAAGMRVLGVATSSPLESIRRCADEAVASLSDISLPQLDQWLGLSQQAP